MIVTLILTVFSAASAAGTNMVSFGTVGGLPPTVTLVSASTDSVLDEDMRLHYTAAQGVVGLTLYSWLVPATLRMEGKTATVTGLWTPVFWTAGQYMFAKANAPVRYPEVLMSTAGAYDGVAHGLMFNHEKADAAMWMSLFENIGGFYLARKTRPTPGAIVRRIFGSINGYIQGFALAEVADAELRDRSKFAAAHSILTGYGSYAASVLLNDTLTTPGDALFEFVSSTTLGASAFMFVATETNDGKAAAASYLIGNYIGYGIGVFLSQKRDISFGGSLVTMIVPYLANGLIAGTMILADVEGETALKIESILLPISVYSVYYMLSN